MAGNTGVEGLVVGAGAGIDVDTDFRMRYRPSTPRTAPACSAIAGDDIEVHLARARLVDAPMGIIAVALDGDATIDSGRVIADGGGPAGVPAWSRLLINGDAECQHARHDLRPTAACSARRRFFGPAVRRTVNMNGNTIDPPLIGAKRGDRARRFTRRY